MFCIHRITKWANSGHQNKEPGTYVMILKIFSPKKLVKKIAVYDSKYCLLIHKMEDDIGFQEKRHFSQKIG
jgi:hypothetical protein